MPIEVEIRSFITESQYHYLRSDFAKRGDHLSDDIQETVYYDAPVDLRIQKNLYYAKIWLKQGNLHEEAREELEIQCKQEDYPKLETLFSMLGYPPKVKWRRHRSTYSWEGITVTLDYTEGYGYIIEFEKLVSKRQKNIALKELKEKFHRLGIFLTKRGIYLKV